MKAAVVNSFDVPPRFQTFDDPVAGTDEEVVEVIAAGLHPITKALANGTHYGSTGKLPFIPGVDGVARDSNGATIYFGSLRAPFGSFCERTLSSRRLSIPLPAGLDPVIAAGIANPGMSSWVALTRRAKLVEGENVLILGATGTAGHLAVQIAKRLGARRVIAAGRNREALESLKELGADETIPLDQDHAELVSSFHREWSGPGIHIVIDYLWGAPAEAVLEAMSLRGFRPAVSRVRFVQVGASAGDTISLAAATLRSSAIELLGSGFGSASMREIFTSLDDFFHAAASLPFQFHAKAAPLRDVETLWNAPQPGARLVFQP